EPTLSAWEAEVLPLNYARSCLHYAPFKDAGKLEAVSFVRIPRWKSFLTVNLTDSPPRPLLPICSRNSIWPASALRSSSTKTFCRGASTKPVSLQPATVSRSCMPSAVGKEALARRASAAKQQPQDKTIEPSRPVT